VDVPAPLATFVAQRMAKHPSALAAAPAGLVWRQPIPPLDVSATRVRALLGSGHSARFLVTDGCLRYIRDHHLYTD
jgi:nicotinate-nucleotide adenylyltransferase